MYPADHINSRSLLRSSSTSEPSDPPHRVVFVFLSFTEVKLDDTQNRINAILKIV
jgi:hypothetical protein